jgi:hypothetical protein
MFSPHGAVILYFHDLIVCFVTPPSIDLLCQLELDNDLLDKRWSQRGELKLFFQGMNHINKPIDSIYYVPKYSFDITEIISIVKSGRQGQLKLI